jgi:beta-glucosidase
MMSDWGATHSTLPAALNGLDQQMPDNSYFGPALAAAVAAGTLPMSRLDDMVLRMLTPMYALNLFATQAGPAPGADPTRNTSTYARSPAHDALALTLAQASITLLKNDGLLPAAPLLGPQAREARCDAAARHAARYRLDAGRKLPTRTKTTQPAEGHRHRLGSSRWTRSAQSS